jgi:hypothetical protein
MMLTETSFALSSKYKLPAVNSNSQVELIPGISTEISKNLSSITDLNYIILDEKSEVPYKYQITYDKKDMSNVEIDLEINLQQDGQNLVLHANGKVDRIKLNEDTVLIRGPIYGEFSWGNIEYDFSAGIKNIEGCDDISIGLCITSIDEKYQVCYGMGTTVMTKEIDEMLDEYRNSQEKRVNSDLPEPSSNESSEVELMNNPNYVYYNYQCGEFIRDNFMPENARTATSNRVFVDNDNKRIMVCLKTFGNTLTQADFPNYYFNGASVGAFQVGLQRTNYFGYIAGMEEVNLSFPSGSNVGLDFVFNAASTLLGLLPYPYGSGASIITGLLAGIDSTTTFQSSGYTDHNKIHCSISSYDKLVIDDASLPVVFQIADSNTSIVNFQGNAYIDVTYLIDLQEFDFYLRTTRANVAVNMYI